MLTRFLSNAIRVLLTAALLGPGNRFQRGGFRVIVYGLEGLAGFLCQRATIGVFSARF